MDPNKTLARILEIVHRIWRVDPTDDPDVIELMEKIEALNEWMSKGGFLPAAWVPDGSLQTNESRYLRALDAINHHPLVLKAGEDYIEREDAVGALEDIRGIVVGVVGEPVKEDER